MDLNELRTNIDNIDKNLIELIGLRFQLTRKVGNVKKELILNSVDNKRFDEVIKNWKENAIKNKLNPELLESLFVLIHEEVVLEHNVKKQSDNKYNAK